MQITTKPDFDEVVTLLKQCELPTADLTPEKLEYFYSVSDVSKLIAVIGLEVHGNYGLLRSLAVEPSLRNQGIAKKLLSQIEQIATEHQLSDLFLLTTTAPVYFSKNGYAETARDKVPDEIKSTSEFASVCPKSAIVMRKSMSERVS